MNKKSILVATFKN